MTHISFKHTHAVFGPILPFVLHFGVDSMAIIESERFIDDGFFVVILQIEFVRCHIYSVCGFTNELPLAQSEKKELSKHIPAGKTNYDEIA